MAKSKRIGEFDFTWKNPRWDRLEQLLLEYEWVEVWGIGVIAKPQTSEAIREFLREHRVPDVGIIIGTYTYAISVDRKVYRGETPTVVNQIGRGMCYRALALGLLEADSKVPSELESSMLGAVTASSANLYHAIERRYGTGQVIRAPETIVGLVATVVSQ